MLIIRVSETRVHVDSGSPVPSGGTAAPEVLFRPDEFWDGYALTAVFEGNGQTRYLANISGEVAYRVPWECVSAAGVVTVRVFGVREDGRATTLPATLQVTDSGLPGALPADPTPSAYEQYVNAVQTNAALAESAAYSAQANADAVAAAAEAIGDIPEMRAAAQSMVEDARVALDTAEAAADFLTRTQASMEEADAEIGDLLERAGQVMTQAEAGAAAVAQADARIRALESKADRQGKQLANLFALHEGGDLSYVTDSAVAAVKSVPAGALPYAEIVVLGGKSEIVDGAVVHHQPDSILSDGPDLPEIFTLPQSVLALEGVGVGINGTCFNAVDLKQRRFLRRVGSVDMGVLNWHYNANRGFFYAYIDTAGSGVEPGKTGASANGLCVGYTAVAVSPVSLSDKCFVLGSPFISAEYGSIALRDDSFEGSVPALLAAFSGRVLYYELKNPVSTNLRDLLEEDNLLEVGAGGSLTFYAEGSVISAPSTVIYPVTGSSPSA